MNTIESFNHQLNESLLEPSSKIQTFQMQVNMLLKSVLKEHSYNNALILGTGKMNDFSLDFFVCNFKEILLTDIDISTVKQELKKQQITKEDMKKIRLKQIEYTGFEQNNFFKKFRKQIITCYNFDQIDQTFQSLINPMKDYLYIDDETFDFIYVSLLYTQLVYNQFMLEIKKLKKNGYPPHLLHYLEELMLEEMVNVIERFNNTTIKALNNKGMMFVLSDIFQVEMDSSFQQKISRNIHNYEGMEKIYKEYHDKYGYGLGDYGLRNLDDTLRKKTSKWLVWPFQDSKEFIVKLTVYTKFNKEEDK